MNEQTKYTVFRRDSDGTIGFLNSCNACSLDEFMREVNAFYGDGWCGEPDLVAWAPQWSHGTVFTDHLCEESVRAGRLIELRNGKYIPLGVPEEKKETPFRVGGRYRIGNGESLVELICERAYGHMPPDGYAAMRMDDGFILYQFARLSDGRAVHACDLQPVGEDCGLDLRAAYVEKADSIPGEKLLETLDNAEPERAPLTWNQPSNSTRWDGYTVKSFDADALNPPAPAGWVSPDLKAVSPLCGSAHLVLED